MRVMVWVRVWVEPHWSVAVKVRVTNCVAVHEVVSQVETAVLSDEVTVTAVQAVAVAVEVGRLSVHEMVTEAGTLVKVMLPASRTLMIWVWVEPAPVQAREMVWMIPPGAVQVAVETVSTKVAGPDEELPHEPPETWATPVAVVEVSPPQLTVAVGGIESWPVVPRMAKSALPRAETVCDAWLLEQSVRPVVESV